MVEGGEEPAHTRGAAADPVSRRDGAWATRLRKLLGPSDRIAVQLWFLSRLAVFVAAAIGPWLVLDGEPDDGALERWLQWDAYHYIEIARFGYDGNPWQEPQPGLPAFFPGLPLLLRLVHVVVPSWHLAGLLISLAGGTVAVIALSRLGELEGPAGTGQRAVLAMVLCPWAVFLAAGYTEALFLGFALPAWLLARRGHWAGAALAAAGASSVRITGVFLAVALVVAWLSSGRVTTTGSATAAARLRQRLVGLPWLALPFVPPLAYVVYLYGRTGDWLAWKHAQEAGWDRALVPPWEALRTTWQAATDPDNTFMWPFRFELLAAAVGLALLGWLLARRRWGEFTYVLLPLVALMTSEYYLSIPRALLLWWPLWLLVARAGLRRPWVFRLYMAVCAPLMIVFVLTFTQSNWAG